MFARPSNDQFSQPVSVKTAPINAGRDQVKPDLDLAEAISRAEKLDDFMDIIESFHDRIDSRSTTPGNQESNGIVYGPLNSHIVVSFFKKAQRKKCLTSMIYAEVIYCLYWSATPAPIKVMLKYFEQAKVLPSGLLPEEFGTCSYFILNAMVENKFPDLKKAIEIISMAKERNDLGMGLITLQNSFYKLILATPDELLSMQVDLPLMLSDLDERVAFYQAEKNLVEQETQEQLDEMARLRLEVKEKIERPMIERRAAEEQLKQQEAKVQAERRQKAEIACQPVEKILSQIIIGRPERDRAKSILNNAKKYDESYGKVEYLLGKLSYESYLDVCGDHRNDAKDASAAADIVRKHLSLAITLSSEPSGFQCVVEASLLLMTLEMSMNHLVAAQGHYQTLNGLNRSADYTESQRERLSKIVDKLFPETQQAKEEALIKKREEEDARKQADILSKKEAKQKAATKKEKQEREAKISKKAVELGVTTLTDASRHYVLAKMYEQEFTALPVAHHTRKMPISEILFEYANAIQLNPDYPEADYARAVFRQKHDPEQSGIADAFERLRAIEAYKVRANFALGQQAQRNDNISEAMRLYENVASVKEVNNQEDSACVGLARTALQEIKEGLLGKFQGIKFKSKSIKNKMNDVLRECEDLIQVWPNFHEARLFLAEQHLNYVLTQEVPESNDLAASASHREKVLTNLGYLQINNSKDFRVYYGLWRFYCHLDASRSLVTDPLEQEEVESPWSELVKNAEFMLENSPSEGSIEELIAFFSQQRKNEEKNEDLLRIFSNIIKNMVFENIKVDDQLTVFKCHRSLYEKKNDQKSSLGLHLAWLKSDKFSTKVKADINEHLMGIFSNFYNKMYELAQEELGKMEYTISRDEDIALMFGLLQFQRAIGTNAGIEDKLPEAVFSLALVRAVGVFKMLVKYHSRAAQLDAVLMLFEKTLELYDFQQPGSTSNVEAKDYLSALHKCAQITHCLYGNVIKTKQYCQRIVDFRPSQPFQGKDKALIEQIYSDAKNFCDTEKEFSYDKALLEEAPKRQFYARMMKKCGESYAAIEGRVKESDYLYLNELYQACRNVYEGLDMSVPPDDRYRKLSVCQMRFFVKLADSLCWAYEQADNSSALTWYERAFEVYDFQPFPFETGFDLREYIRALNNCAKITFILEMKDPKVLEYFQKILFVSSSKNFEKLLFDHSMDDGLRDEVTVHVDQAKRFLVIDASGNDQLNVAVSEGGQVSQVTNNPSSMYGKQSPDQQALLSSQGSELSSLDEVASMKS